MTWFLWVLLGWLLLSLSVGCATGRVLRRLDVLEQRPGVPPECWDGDLFRWLRGVPSIERAASDRQPGPSARLH